MRTNFSRNFDPNDMGREADQLRHEALRAYHQDDLQEGRRLSRIARRIDNCAESYSQLMRG